MVKSLTLLISFHYFGGNYPSCFVQIHFSGWSFSKILGRFRKLIPIFINLQLNRIILLPMEEKSPRKIGWIYPCRVVRQPHLLSLFTFQAFQISGIFIFFIGSVFGEKARLYGLSKHFSSCGWGRGIIGFIHLIFYYLKSLRIED